MSNFNDLNFKHEDKLQHFIVGGLMSFCFLIIFKDYLDLSFAVSLWLSIGIASMIGIGFELFSLISRIGTYDFWDIVWTLLGIPLGIYLGMQVVIG